MLVESITTCLLFLNFRLQALLAEQICFVHSSFLFHSLLMPEAFQQVSCGRVIKL